MPANSSIPYKNLKYVPRPLQKSLLSGRCIAFIGAGFSMPCGMPSWSGLVDKLLKIGRESGVDKDTLDGAKYASTQGQYPLAAKLLRDKLNSPVIESFLRDAFSIDKLRQSKRNVIKRMHLRMQNLVNASWAGYITTNYDTLIEEAFRITGVQEPYMVQGADPSLANVLGSECNGRRFLVKLHGSNWTKFKVLCSQEYERYYVRNEMISMFLNAAMMQYSIAFVGCSLFLDEIINIRRKLILQFEGQVPMCYAILQNTSINRARLASMRDDYGIDCILYDASSPKTFGDHSAVDVFLKQAAKLR